MTRGSTAGLLFFYSFDQQPLAMQKYVLMLEEDSDDQFLTREVLDALELDVHIRFVATSNELFSALEGQHLPELILIDHNSIPEDGLTVLKKIKDTDTLTHIPVVILSDNNLPHYKNECYASGASSFIRKPANMQLTQKKIDTFFRYWFDVAEL
jgi:two-component system response regulator